MFGRSGRTMNATTAKAKKNRTKMKQTADEPPDKREPSSPDITTPLIPVFVDQSPTHVLNSQIPHPRKKVKSIHKIRLPRYNYEYSKLMKL